MSIGQNSACVVLGIYEPEDSMSAKHRQCPGYGYEGCAITAGIECNCGYSVKALAYSLDGIGSGILADMRACELK